MKCPTCQGEGVIINRGYIHEHSEPCPRCKGTGNLKEPEHIERMEEERLQLAERLVKLTLFTLSPEMGQLDRIDQILLCRQGIHMAKYLEVLNARIDRA